MSEPAKQQLFSLAELREASAAGRTLIAVFDKVYDVSSFLNEHPGGEEILLEHGGKEATDDFVDVNHSADALELMGRYLVGELAAPDRRNLPEREGWRPGGKGEPQARRAGPEDGGRTRGEGERPGLPLAVFTAAAMLVVVAVVYLAIAD